MRDGLAGGGSGSCWAVWEEIMNLCVGLLGYFQHWRPEMTRHERI
jgi:hypothetical protein